MLNRPAIVMAAVLTGLFVLLVEPRSAELDWALNLPYFIGMCLLLWSVGVRADESHPVSAPGGSGQSLLAALGVAVSLPLFLAGFIVSYIVASGQPVSFAPLIMLTLVLLTPAVWFAVMTRQYSDPGRADIFGSILCALPFFFPKFPYNTEIPLDGRGFDSLYNTAVLIAAVWAVVQVRRLPGVGFSVPDEWRGLLWVAGAWLLLMLIVLPIGVSTGFMYPVDQPLAGSILASAVAFKVVESFLHTALREEFLVRGLIQNIWTRQLACHSALLEIQRLASGFLLTMMIAASLFADGHYSWLPCLIAFVILLGGYLLERAAVAPRGVIAGLVLTSVLFGVVHVSKNSDVFLALATLAGLFYGIVYIKTRNLFYTALLHAMVNASPLLFGLALFGQG